MTTGISNFLGNAWADHVHGNAVYTAPTNLFVAAFTTAPSDAGGGTEPSGGSYARVSTNSADWNSATATGQIDNANDITFTTATADWGEITHGGLFDAVSGGNYLGGSALTSSKTVENGDTLKFPAGDLNVDYNAN